MKFSVSRCFAALVTTAIVALVNLATTWHAVAQYPPPDHARGSTGATLGQVVNGSNDTPLWALITIAVGCAIVAAVATLVLEHAWRRRHSGVRAATA